MKQKSIFYIVIIAWVLSICALFLPIDTQATKYLPGFMWLIVLPIIALNSLSGIFILKFDQFLLGLWYTIIILLAFAQLLLPLFYIFLPTIRRYFGSIPIVITIAIYLFAVLLLQLRHGSMVSTGYILYILAIFMFLIAFLLALKAAHAVKNEN